MDFIRTVLEKSGFVDLNPVQKEAVDAGLLEGKSLVVAAPTASGKTLIAEIATLNTVLGQGKKVVYIVPLRALASEKYDDFREKYSSLGIKTAMSIGDLDQSDPWLSKFDVIVVTSEKLDSLLRHGIGWIDQVGLVVLDEIHLMTDPGRGPTLEIIATKMKGNRQLLGLSATIRNYEEIAEWLDAAPVKSDYRPVKLYSGVFLDSEVHYQPKKPSLKVKNEYPPAVEIAEHTVGMGKQALMFVSTRKNAEALSEQMGKIIRRRLSPEELDKLGKISRKILGAVEKPTMQCEKLAGVVSHGVAFHHAGITNEQRKLVENGFREGVVKIIAATPTLAAGVNIPAYRVVIRDLKRFSSGYGMDYLPVLEAQQMLGRAGRPKYDTEGEAIMIAKNKGEARHLWDTYVKGEPEDIQSKLGVETVLRTHVLALVASGNTSKQDLFEFFSGTFYAHQYKDASSLNGKIEKVLGLLKDYRFVVDGGRSSSDNPFRSAAELESEDSGLEATPLGKRVSELYLDPLTANYLITNMEKKKDFLPTLGLLQLISNTLEMRPGLSVRKGDAEKINSVIASGEGELIEKPPNPWEIDYEDYLRSLKTALFFSEWISELGEDLIFENFGVTPGELRVRLNNADWLLYSVHELALLLGMKPALGQIRKTRLRVKYGIREELLPLVRLKGIGRVRARMLYNSNIKGLADLRKVPEESLGRIVGPAVAKSLKEQLNQMEDSQETLGDY